MEIKNYEYVLIPNILKEYKCSASGECCRDKWRIDIDETAYIKTKNELDKLNEDIGTYIEKKENNQYYSKFANGYCKFITDKKLCRIHKDFGWECLSDTCKIYPRMLKLTSRGMELSLVFSCESAAKLLLTNEKFQISKINKEEFFFMKPSNVSFIIPENNLDTSLSYKYYDLEEFILNILNNDDFCNISLGKKMQYVEKILSELSNQNCKNVNFQEILENFKKFEDKSLDETETEDFIVKTILAKQERTKSVGLEFINLFKLIKLNKNLEQDKNFLRTDSFIFTGEDLQELKKLWNKKYENILKNYLSCFVFSKDLYSREQYGFMKMILLGTMLKLKILLNKKYLGRDLTDEELIFTIKTHDNDFSHDGEFFNKFFNENQNDIQKYNRKMLTVLY